MTKAPSPEASIDVANPSNAKGSADLAAPKSAGYISSQMVILLALLMMVVAIANAVLVPYYMQAAAMSSLERASLDLALAHRAFAQGDKAQTVLPRAAEPGDTSPTIRFIWPKTRHPTGDTGLDNFEFDAWTALKKDPNAVTSRLETLQGTRYLRLALADNDANPRGLLVITRSVEADLVESEAISDQIFWMRLGLSIIVTSVLIWLNIQTRRRAREHSALFNKVSEMAYIDGMTGLMNRSRFMQLAQAMADSQQNYSIHMIDVDRFKEINDDYGHRAGDDLIREVAHRLNAMTRPGDLLARLGGDEFILAAPIRAESSPAQDLAAAIVEALRQPVESGDLRLEVSASVGTAVSSQERRVLDQIIQDADEALYIAKQSGRGRFECFTDMLQNVRQERRTLEKLLTQTTSHRAFEYHYQPVVDATTNRVKSFEVLLRLRDRDGKFVPPSTFIPVAEDMKLICDIGEQVMRQSITFAAGLPSDIAININLSPRQFSIKENNGRTIAETLRPILEETGIDPGRVVLEMTESALLSDTSAVIRQLEQLKALGVRTALDDFGSGYSSLSYLWKFSFDSLKIDQSFARGLDTNSHNMAEIVRSIVNLSQSLKLEIVAEGIETEAEAAFFRDCGCDALQGYLISRPIPDTDVAAFVLTKSLPPAIAPAVPLQDVA